MKVRIESDLHLEWYDKEPFCLDSSEDEQNTILILAGDICILSKIKKFEYFFNDVTTRFKHVLYVFGNHEFYKGSVKLVNDYISQLSYPNLTVLNRSYIDIENYRFLGSTMWSDYNNYDELTAFIVRKRMNDFHCIRTGSYGVPYMRKFDPKDAFVEFNKTIEFFKKSYSTEHTNIVITHHAPSFKSIAEKFKNSSINHGYCSDLSEHILQYNPKLWIHGHIHESVSYEIGNTQIESNPKGYPGELKDTSYFTKVLEI